MKMEYQKVTKLLSNIHDQVPKFITKNGNANCSKCNEWYHLKCLTIPENAFENSRLD